MVKGKEEIGGTATLSVEESERLYWVGSLPKAGSFIWHEPTTDKGSKYSLNTADEYTREITTDAWTLWTKGEIWRGKCDQIQNLSVTGMEFAAFSSRPITAQDGKTTFDHYPGLVCRLSKEDADAIVARCFSNFVREPNGVGTKNASHTVAIKDPVSTAAPTVYNQMDPNERPVQIEHPKFDKRRDTPVAQYVYMVPLDASLDTPLKEYHRLAPSMSEFFKNPPKSVADMYGSRRTEA